jgi:hypothetical protein
MNTGMATDNCETGVTGRTPAGSAEEQLALSQCHNRNPVTVSSLSSIDTAAYDYNDTSLITTNNLHNNTQQSSANAHPLPTIPNQSTTVVDNNQSLALSQTYIGADRTRPQQEHQQQQLQHQLLPSHLTSSTGTLIGQTTMRLSPTTRVIVPASSSVNTVPEFLCSLTKMLTDNNRDTIEWSNGK